MRQNTPSATRSRILCLDVEHAGERLPVEVELRRQPRARHFRLRVKTRNRALLTLPWNASYAEAEAFLNSNIEWLGQHLVTKPDQNSLANHMEQFPTVSVRGKSYSLDVVTENARNRLSVRVDRERERVQVALPRGISIITSEIWLDVLKQIAKVQLDLRVCDLAERISIEIPDVSVRDQESRWGSCSSSGRISLNWRLIMLPPVLQDYVIYHELAHLEEMNHSPRFWDLLHTYDPRAGRHDLALSKEYGFLMNFGRE
ncbi:MAG: M48 family metallopeptidase [Opitutales bacterium]